MTDNKKKRKKRSRIAGWVIPSIITAIIFVTATVCVKSMMSGDETKRRRQIQMIKLLEPQAPPKKIEEKLPEPEKQKEIKQEIQEVMQEQLIQETSQPDESNSDEPPAGQDLGLDADGSAGSDGFGLVGKKGGRSLIGGSGGGGGSGGNSLMQKYGWYIQKVQDSIREYLKKELEKDGGIPEGNLQATLRIVLDEQGKITNFNILGSSGSNKMDNAIEAVIKLVDIDDPPPDGMPKSIKIRVSSRG
jgi:periplasmic protein TonB